MRTDKNKVEYLVACRMCHSRSLLAENIFTTYDRTKKLILDKFTGLFLMDCDRCDNHTVHDLLGLSREAGRDE